MKSAELVPGYVSDLYSAFYPLSVASPALRDLGLEHHGLRPSDLERDDANLHTGAVNGGTSQLFQQLIFRPAPGLGRAETPVEQPAGHADASTVSYPECSRRHKQRATG